MTDFTPGVNPSSDDCPKKGMAFINANLDQRIATVRDMLFKANDNGVGIALNAEIEATIDMMLAHENPVNRICGELLEIGHCTVINSMAESVGIVGEPPNDPA